MTRGQREALLKAAQNPLGVFRCLFKTGQTEDTYIDYDQLHGRARERRSKEDREFVQSLGSGEIPIPDPMY